MNLDDKNLKHLLLLNTLGSRIKVMEWLAEGIPPSEIIERINAIPSKIKQNQTVPRTFPNENEEKYLVPSAFNPEKEIERCDQLGIQLLTWFDSNYPYLLKQIPDPPLVLYRKGNLEVADQAAIAIVGTRYPSLYGFEQARKFSKKLAQFGLTIVSGFARGIDQAAHEAALQISHGRTLAVLGCGIDVIYPKGSEGLFKKIAGSGALITEYPLGMPPLAENFPKRNRIISGLSLGVLVVEAARRSGSLITAHEAVDQGRDVFAIPGSIEHMNSAGTHQLIKEGAYLVEEPEEVFEMVASSFKPVTTPAPVIEATPQVNVPNELKPPVLTELAGLSDNENRIMKAIQQIPLFPNEIAIEVKTPMAEVVSTLAILEMKRLLRRRPEGKFEIRPF